MDKRPSGYINCPDCLNEIASNARKVGQESKDDYIGTCDKCEMEAEYYCYFCKECMKKHDELKENKIINEGVEETEAVILAERSRLKSEIEKIILKHEHCKENYSFCLAKSNENMYPKCVNVIEEELAKLFNEREVIR